MAVGVEKSSGGYAVRLCVNGNKIYVGGFDNEKDAFNEYKRLLAENGRIINKEGNSLESLIGKKYGYLEVISYVENRKTRGLQWECRCDCGNIAIVLGAHLKNGNTKSCGCFKPIMIRDKVNAGHKVSSFNRVYAYYKRNAKKRGIGFHLTKEEFKEICVLNCHYCGGEPKNLFKREDDFGKFIYTGIDRMNSELGYIKNNCVPCCSVCNRAKSDMSYDSFIKYLDLVVLKRSPK